MAGSSPAPSPLLTALSTFVCGGSLWGAAEGLVLCGRRWSGAVPAGELPSNPLAVAAPTPDYAVAALVFGMPCWLLWRLVRPCCDPDSSRRRARILVMGGALFGTLFWITKPLFLWGVPYTDPRRIAFLACLLAASLALGHGMLRTVGTAWRRVEGRVVGTTTVCLMLMGAGWRMAEAGSAPDAGAREGSTNLVLVVVDALRADHLEPHGSALPTVHTTALAAQGAVFERCIAQAPFTWTSFGSFFTGKYPWRHGLVRMDEHFRMPRRNTTLAQVLAREGWRTGAILTGTMTRGTGLLEGFQVYFEEMVGHETVETWNDWTKVRSRLVVWRFLSRIKAGLGGMRTGTEAVRFIEENAGRPFFAMVHLYTTHTPYDPPERYRKGRVDPLHGVQVFTSDHRKVMERGDVEIDEPLVRQIRGLYEGGVLWADEVLGQIQQALSSAGVADKTIVVLTSDHGEELGDHGVWEHGWMWDTNLHIPWILSGPGVSAGLRVPDIVESVDLMPTVLGLLGVEPPGDMDGVDWGPVLSGTGPAPVDAWGAFGFSENEDSISLTGQEWKLVRNKESGVRQLFRLSDDPAERRDLAGDGLDHEQRLDALLTAWNDAQPRGTEERQTPDQAAARLLQELGYVDDE